MKIILLLTAIMVLTGCQKKHVELQYPLFEKSVAVTKPALSRVRLDIQVFGDIRREVPEDKVLFDDSERFVKDGRRFCVNAEKNYEPDLVVYQISNAIAKHLNKRGAFMTVSFDHKDSADYYVTGKVRRFYGEKEDPKISSGPLTLLGAPVVTLESRSRYFIEFTDLHIVAATGQVVQFPDINEKNEELSFGSCDLVYGFINLKLKQPIDKLANNIENAIVILQSKKNELTN